MAPPIASEAQLRPRGVFLGAVLALAPRPVLGQTASDSTRAQHLFDEARVLMKTEKYAEACPMLAESQALDPGGGTILNLGICHARQGRTATAWNELQQALERARSDSRADRVKTAQKHLDALSASLSRLRIELSNRQEVPGLTIEIDGVSLPEGEFDLPVDPGNHEVKAFAPGRRPWAVRVTIAPVSDRQLVQIPVLEPETPAERAPIVPLRTQPTIAPRPDRPPTTARAELGPKPEARPRWIGFSALGVGAASLGVGTYFAIRSFTLKKESDRDWDGKYCVRKACAEAWDDAKTAARVADVGIAVGLVAIGVGAYLVFRPDGSGSAASAVQVSVGPTPSGGALNASANF